MLPVVHVRDAEKCYEAWEDFVFRNNRVSVCRRLAIQRRLCFTIGGRQTFLLSSEMESTSGTVGRPAAHFAEERAAFYFYMLRDKRRRTRSRVASCCPLSELGSRPERC
jgi:hypothetical protein